MAKKETNKKSKVGVKDLESKATKPALSGKDSVADVESAKTSRKKTAPKPKKEVEDKLAKTSSKATAAPETKASASPATKPEKQATQKVRVLSAPEQLIMDGVEPPPAMVEELSVEIYSKRLEKQKRRSLKLKKARVLTKEELGLAEKPVKKKKTKHLKIEEVSRYAVDYKKGLNKEQVNRRTQQGLNNEIKSKNAKTYKSIFFGNIFTFFNLLTFLVAGMLIYVGSIKDTVFMAIVLLNIVIGIVQEIKAKKTIQKISLVSAPTAVVLRDGILQEIDVKDVVLDDIIEFTLGKQICADSEVVEGEVEVNESLLTGESVPVKKKKGDILLSGSFVVSGKCVAKVNKVGNYNYSATLAAKAKQYTKPKSELLYSLKIVIRTIGVFIIPIAILMYNNNFAGSGDFADAVRRTSTVVVGMIPAGMFLLTSLALAVGVIKLAKKRTLVQDLYSIEMLARTDVLCLDKTGTITDGTMKVNTVIQLEKKLNNTISEIMGSMLTALDDNNQTSRALTTHFGYSKELLPKSVVSFSSARKYSAVNFLNGDSYVFGAPEFVYKQKDVAMDELVKQYASKGFRVLLLAKTSGQEVSEKLPSKIVPVAIIVIEDRIREDAEETIKWFKENGVQIKIISGDNPVTVSEVSKRVGVDRADKFISLEGLSEQQVIESANKYTVFGRVSPEQKLILVKALKNRGHKVAMTGDGVNDILALKEADCSIAMASGSEAARHVSNLVLLDSNFSSMPSVVAEGRRVVNNIQKSSSLFLMKTLFTIMLATICLIIAEPYPFMTTNQILLLEYTVIGLPSFFLAMQSNSEKIKGGFLANLFSKSMPGALLLLFNVIAIYLFELFIGTSGQYITMASLAISFTGLLVLLRLCKPLNLFRTVLWGSMVALSVAILTFIPLDFFSYSTLSMQNIFFIIILVQASYPIYNTFVKVIDKIRFLNENRNEYSIENKLL